MDKTTTETLITRVEALLIEAESKARQPADLPPDPTSYERGYADCEQKWLPVMWQLLSNIKAGL